jgi:hypothetical protein
VAEWVTQFNATWATLPEGHSTPTPTPTIATPILDTPTHDRNAGYPPAGVQWTIILVVLGFFIVRLIRKHLPKQKPPPKSSRRIPLCIHVLYWIPLAAILLNITPNTVGLVVVFFVIKFFRYSWILKNEKAKAGPDPAAPEPPPGPRPLFDSPALTAKERKILDLALDKAAQPGESDSAWQKFGRSLRTRGVGRV